jgi:serine/threonine protein kinase
VPVESASTGVPELSGRVLLGRYRVVRPLARGGMGVVYLGRVEGAAGFSKPVVIKTLLAHPKDGDDGAQLFAREARIVSHLQHPGIVAVIDFGRVDGTQVMVLEYVHGYNLGQWFRYFTEARGLMPLHHALHVILGVLDALDYAHGLTRPDGTPFGIIHRDISPGNVLIDLQGRVKLADFGIARTADDEFKTQQGMFRGTLPFSAPEVLHGDPVDGRCDEYACAVLLYQLLTGVHPFKGDETAQTITRILTHTPPPVASLRSDVPPEIDAAIMKALSKDPADRFPGAAQFAEALRAGCSWSEREAAQDFSQEIETGFFGDMPERLGLEPLSVRDASWRETQDGANGPRVSLSSSPPEMRSAVTKRLTGGEPSTVVVPFTPVAKPSGPPRQASSWALVAAAGLAAIAAVAAAVSVLMRPTAEGPQKLIVVEKQANPEAMPAPGASSAPAPTPPPESTSPAASAPSGAGARVSSTKPAAGGAARGGPIGRAFQQQEGAIQRCFQQSPETLESTPRLTVRFDVGRDGHVTGAALDPGSVSGQPLGRCILGIARATNFGPQPEPVSFSIPIAARVVRH